MPPEHEVTGSNPVGRITVGLFGRRGFLAGRRGRWPLRCGGRERRQPTGWGIPDCPLVVPGPPSVETDAAERVTTTGATLHGRVDKLGAAGGTECSFQIAAASDPTFAAPLKTVACEPILVEGASVVAVSAALTGLSPHTDYLFRAEGTNAEGGPIYGRTRTTCAFEVSDAEDIKIERAFRRFLATPVWSKAKATPSPGTQAPSNRFSSATQRDMAET